LSQLIGLQGDASPPPPHTLTPFLLFGQLIDLSTLTAGRVSLNLISEFIFWETCVYRNDVESRGSESGPRAEAKIKLQFKFQYPPPPTHTHTRTLSST